jgi:hypothetical protein
MTMFELILAITFVTLIGLGISSLFRHSMIYLRRNQARSQMNLESRAVVETLTPALQHAIDSTLVFCPCGPNACAPGCPGAESSPYNRLEFQANEQGISTYSFYQQNDTIVFLTQKASGSVLGPRTLAKNVKSFSFGYDLSDPTLVLTSLFFEAQVGPQQKETLLLTNIPIRTTGRAPGS